MNKSVLFDSSNHEFKITEYNSDSDLDKIHAPLSVILQVTRRCNLKCNFCSESQYFADPQIEKLIDLIPLLKGVQRVYLSGGEPLLRKDIFELIYEFSKQFPVLGLPTNTTMITNEICNKLYGKVSYVNAGLDGPRNINDLVRGGYDGIIKGLQILRDNNIEVSLSTVILKKTLPYLQHVIQIADVLNITKVKMVVPVLRGRAAALTDDDFADKDDILDKFKEICILKEELGFRPRVKVGFWSSETEGYALIIYPDFNVYAWPVFNQPDAVLHIGSLEKESMSAIWEKYPYKYNHIKKYTGITMLRT